MHPVWVNIDYSRRAALVKCGLLRWCLKSQLPESYLNHDLRRGIPFPDGSADAVYSSHLLEHLPHEVVLPFCREQWRVLKPGGIVRVVVPDLEVIAAEYLAAVTKCRRGTECAWLEHEWATILLVDQMVRSNCGGEMDRWLQEHRESSFVKNKRGVFAEIAKSKKPRDNATLTRRLAKWMVNEHSPAATGELHRWMYDEISLRGLLQCAGLRDISRVRADSSGILDWNNYLLDCDADGTAHQPGSLYMEARK